MSGFDGMFSFSPHGAPPLFLLRTSDLLVPFAFPGRSPPAPRPVPPPQRQGARPPPRPFCFRGAGLFSWPSFHPPARLPDQRRERYSIGGDDALAATTRCSDTSHFAHTHSRTGTAPFIKHGTAQDMAIRSWVRNSRRRRGRDAAAAGTSEKVGTRLAALSVP